MKSAVILAAGQGLRLRPLTDKIPKCLAAVHGKSIMSYQLAALERAGIQRCVMVVGYMAGLVRDKFGSQYNAMELSYVENKCYAETNNLYSLWLAREQIADDILLLECDIIFEDSVLSELIESPILETACVDEYQPHMDGTVILARNGVAESMVLKVDQGPDFNYSAALKTVNIYKFSYATMKNLVIPALDRFVANGLTGVYYEAVFSELISSSRLRLGISLVGNRRWAEIDTIGDMREAEKIFSHSD